MPAVRASIRGELFACVEGGKEGRIAGVSRLDNPHLLLLAAAALSCADPTLYHLPGRGMVGGLGRNRSYR